MELDNFIDSMVGKSADMVKEIPLDPIPLSNVSEELEPMDMSYQKEEIESPTGAVTIEVTKQADVEEFITMQKFRNHSKRSLQDGY